MAAQSLRLRPLYAPAGPFCQLADHVRWNTYRQYAYMYADRGNGHLSYDLVRFSYLICTALLNRISHGTDSSHVWKIRSDLSRGVKNSTDFFTAAERIPHLSVTNSFGISFIYSTQTYLSSFKKTLQKVFFFFCFFFHARISHKRICHSLWYKTYD